MYNPFFRFVDYLRYREAVNQANKAYQKTGHRHYVMPYIKKKGGKPELVITNRKNFRILKQKGYINRKATVFNLVDECFYCTPYANGNGYLDKETLKQKLELYYSYCKSTRELAKQKKDGKGE